MSRPKLPAGQRKSKLLRIRVTHDELACFQEAAELMLGPRQLAVWVRNWLLQLVPDAVNPQARAEALQRVAALIRGIAARNAGTQKPGVPHETPPAS